MNAHQPDFTRLNRRALKRQLSHNEEQHGRKQAQFICDVPYATIIEGALRAFMPLVSACLQPHSETYEHTFCGLNSYGEFDRNMRLTIHAQHHGPLPKLDGEWYRLWVTLQDAHGRVRIQKRMEESGMPVMHYVCCLGRSRTYEELATKQQMLRSELVRVIRRWLAWFGQEFAYT